MPRTHTALIVDDNYYNRDIAALALQHVGYEITQVTNGYEALHVLQAYPFDLLILDLRMDGMDGTEVLQAVRVHKSKEDLPIVVMTANPHMVTDQVNEQADYVLFKPINVTEFSQLARRILNQHRKKDPEDQDDCLAG